MVVDPRKVFYNKHFQSVLDGRSANSYNGEMDWVNEEFHNTAGYLDGFHALLIGEWCPSDGIYKHWQKHFGKSSKWVMEHATLVHFIADWKPWKHTSAGALRRKCPGFQPELLEIYEKWWNTKRQVC